MNTVNSTFTQQVKAMSVRLTSLYQGLESQPSSALLASALKELGIASERLQAAAKLLHQQHEQLSLGAQTTARVRQCYQELLEFIPDACMLTDATGRIQEANRAASSLLNLPPELLKERSLITLIAPESRSPFKADLQRLEQRLWKQEWQLCLQPHQGMAVAVSALVEVSRTEATQPMLRWLLRPFSSPNRVIVSELLDSNAQLDYPLQLYHKGETIPLNPQTIWQVQSGLVKLTTVLDNGQEVVMGLAGASAPFGASLTAMMVYEATALVDTRLWCIPFREFSTSNKLQQRLLPQINQRLKQTELLLAIRGRLRIADRLHSLLQLLKQEIGQPVPEGTRLGVRLTHEELAAACCTTRVTITRGLGQLQQENKLKVDSEHHLILKDCFEDKIL